jgi:hypothetical protein
MIKKEKLIDKTKEFGKEEESLFILIKHYLAIIEESTMEQALKQRVRKILKHVIAETKQHHQSLNKLVMSLKRRKKNDY